MSTPRILIATPVGGHPSYASVSLAYASALYRLSKSCELIDSRVLGNCDLVRARSRAVRIFLASAATHLLFWDADVGGDVASALLGMLSTGADFIAADYPRKLYRPGFRTASAHHLKTGHVGMGFTLLSRSCLERMAAAYRDELSFVDYQDEERHTDTVALFALKMILDARGDRIMLSEDFSFTQRWFDLGGDVHLYQGPGSPLEHIGGHVYRDSAGLPGTSPEAPYAPSATETHPAPGERG